jgi:hypothetical protein
MSMRTVTNRAFCLLMIVAMAGCVRMGETVAQKRARFLAHTRPEEVYYDAGVPRRLLKSSEMVEMTVAPYSKTERTLPPDDWIEIYQLVCRIPNIDRTIEHVTVFDGPSKPVAVKIQTGSYFVYCTRDNVSQRWRAYEVYGYSN